MHVVARVPPQPSILPWAALQDRSRAPSKNIRTLSDAAVFADLVEVAAITQQAGSESDESPCMLQPIDEGRQWYIGVDFASAIRLLPRAPDLDRKSLHQGSNRVRIVTRWSTLGAGRSFTALSNLPLRKTDRAALLVQTENGLLLRATHRELAQEDLKPFELNELPSRIRSALPDGVDAVFVTADRDTKLKEMARVLWTLGELHPRVGLAAALPVGTKLAPSEIQKPEDKRLLCSPLTEKKEGSLDMDALQRGVKPLRSAATSCYESTAARSIKSGKVVVELRIDVNGVPSACIAEDEIRDSALNVCVLSYARALRFEQPSPSGQVIVALPFSFSATLPTAQKPICSESL